MERWEYLCLVTSTGATWRVDNFPVDGGHSTGAIWRVDNFPGEMTPWPQDVGLQDLCSQLGERGWELVVLSETMYPECDGVIEVNTRVVFKRRKQ